MNILLTGGAGYIGSHVAVELIEQGHSVIVVDLFSNSSEQVLERIEAITGRRPKLYAADVCDTVAMDAIFSQNQVDVVAHLAGLKAVGESVALPLQYYRNNLDSTLTLMECMQKHGVGRLLFSSSATVYGAPETLPFTEGMPAGGCFNPYGWTKVVIEQIIQDYAVATPSFSAVLLRYFNPVGAHPSGLIGENPKDVPNNLMPYICQVAAGQREYLSVYGGDYPTPDGTGVRDYIHVVDLAKGFTAALDFSLQNQGAEVFNLGAGRGYSVLDMVRAFEAANGVRVPYRIAPRRPGDIAEFYADPAKAQCVLGWQTELSLEDMCRDAWNWQKNSLGQEG